jgi:hypothetical protein
MDDQTMDLVSVGNGLDDLSALGTSSRPVPAVVPFEKKVDVATELACENPEQGWIAGLMPEQ